MQSVQISIISKKNTNYGVVGWFIVLFCVNDMLRWDRVRTPTVIVMIMRTPPISLHREETPMNQVDM